MAYPFEAARVGYGNLWREARVKPGADSQNADRFADKIIANEARYRYVQNTTGVPWFFVAALHMRESSCNFDGVLHNGEKIIGTGRETRLVPAGHGPFATWEESAVDALKLKDLHRVQEWSIERMLYSAEVYNGLGYLGKVNSPYVWAGTTLEQTGKYVADHVWDPSAEDTQLGVAALLKRLAERRQDIAQALQPSQPEVPQPGNTGVVTLPIFSPPVPAGQSLDLSAFLGSAVTLYEHHHAGTLTQADVVAFVQPLLARLVQPAPIVVPQPAKPATPAADPAAPTGWFTPIDKIFAKLGLSGFAGVSGLQFGGKVGTPFEMFADPSMWGTVLTSLTGGSAALGLSGGAGLLAKYVALPLLGKLFAGAEKPK